ncbi:hypothetical protein CVT24_004133 [Panaeolus cyanescens]|uniref:Vesicle transport protein n=1 Tax=Panaeolus cyanescens TaxID=181874 RepID=A0A409Y5Z3_9AGAR|nr:hypothetical protein CVT24_004133 [Panaeolus cyanescens]
MWLSDAQKIGVALTTFGALFMLLGVMLFFDGALLALGNILFISGLTLIIGPQKTFYFFARKQKLRGTICFLGGILLVFLKWPFIGMIVETFGFLNLFGLSTASPGQERQLCSTYDTMFIVYGANETTRTLDDLPKTNSKCIFYWHQDIASELLL